MSLVVDKVVRLSDERARRLGQLAADKGVTEDALIEEALDLLFQEQEEAIDIDAAIQADVELLRQLEAELGPSTARIVPPLDPADIVVTHAVPIRPELVRRRVGPR